MLAPLLRLIAGAGLPAGPGRGSGRGGAASNLMQGLSVLLDFRRTKITGEGVQGALLDLPLARQVRASPPSPGIDGEFASQRGEFTCQCGEFASQCGEFASQCGEFTSQCGKFASQRGEFTSQCGEFANRAPESTKLTVCADWILTRNYARSPPPIGLGAVPLSGDACGRHPRGDASAGVVFGSRQQVCSLSPCAIGARYGYILSPLPRLVPVTGIFSLPWRLVPAAGIFSDELVIGWRQQRGPLQAAGEPLLCDGHAVGAGGDPRRQQPPAARGNQSHEKK